MTLPNPIGPIMVPPSILQAAGQGVATAAKAATDAEQAVEQGVQSARAAVQTAGSLVKLGIVVGALWLLEESNRKKASDNIMPLALAALALL